MQRRKKKNTNLNYPKLQNENETTLKHCISLALEVQGAIYSKGGHGTQNGGYGPWHHSSGARTVAETPPRPRFRGHTGASRGPVCPLSGPVPGFVLQPLVLTNQLL